MISNSSDKQEGLHRLNRSISLRLAAWGVCIALVFGLLISCIQIYVDLVKLEDELTQTVNQTLSIMEKPLSRAVYELDNSLAEEIALGLLAYRPIILVTITNDGGELMTERRREETMEPAWWMPDFLIKDNRKFEAKISIDGITLEKAKLVVEVDTVYAYKTFFERSFFILLAGIVRNILLAIALLALCYFVISLPLIRLIQKLIQVDANNPKSTRLPIPKKHEKDEIGTLSRTVNTLLDSIQNNINQFRDLNVELEQRVNERTHDLAQAKNEAEKANLSKSTFLANMSHEIRTPMTAILGFSEIMQVDSSLTEEEKMEFLHTINDSGSHLLGLINDILDISKIEAGHTSLMNTDFSLKSMLHSMEQMFRIRTDKKAIKLIFEGVDELPDGICCDEGKLRQILINMLGNAVKFTEYGQVVCRCDAMCQHDDKIELIIDVIDTGPGIADSEKDKVFSTFEQTQAGIQHKGGTGLGLAISREYARMLGGDISFESTLGAGTKFQLKLTVKEGHAKSVKQRQSVIGLQPGQPNKKLLIVDDDEAIRYLQRRILFPIGFEIVEACDGVQAVRQFKKESPDLVLMDRRMPRLDGLEATKLIKAIEGGKKIPVISITASSFAEERQYILDQGADDFIRKPFGREELLEVVGRHLGLTYEYEGESEKSEEKIEDLPADELTDESNIEDVQEKKVLIVDDNKVNRMVASKMLKKEGYLCFEASNGQEALDTLERWHPDIVLLDINMPVMDGYEVLEIARDKGISDSLPFVATTADNDPKVLAKLTSLGAAAICEKPLVLDNVKETVNELLKTKKYGQRFTHYDI